MTRFIAIAAVATLIAMPAYATDPAKKADGKDPMAKRVCVVKTTTGSLLDKKECRTRGEWIALTGVDPVKK
ncbi:MAG: hypothetical protein EOP60_02635 [Sphingomonadales bacterium]|nr:MAG: hypothetical protein EOP60_02635 [Sphingomonadales bacterium]